METNNNQELVKVESTSQSVFINKDSFEHAQRVAKMLCESDLVPVTFKNKIGNCVIALNMAARMKADPLMVMQNMNVIHGKPSWASAFLIATFNSSGGFSKLKYIEDEQNGGRCMAYATDLSDNEKCEGVWVTMEMAKAEGWIDKNGSKWKTMPQLMRRYRAASFFIRQFAPEISMGFQTKEEMEDAGYTVIESTPLPSNDNKKAEAELERVKLLLTKCTTRDEVQRIQVQCPEMDLKLFTDRIAEIEGGNNNE